MNFHVDNKELSLYITTKRNGSTLMNEISSVTTYLKSIQMDEVSYILSKEKDIPIYAPIRDPLVRFKSGLSVNLYNRTDFKINQVDDESLKLYRQLLIYFDDCMGETGNLMSTYKFRPYHLYDGHCDHWLGSLMLFPALGFNLKIITMDNFSEHLMSKFNNVYSFVKKRERPDSFNNAKSDYEKLWEIYKEVFIERIPDHIQSSNEKPITFDQWMNTELEIFNLLIKHKDSELNRASSHHLNKLLDDKNYYTDLYSPNAQRYFTILEGLSEYKLINSRLYKILALYRGIKENHYKLSNLDV